MTAEQQQPKQTRAEYIKSLGIKTEGIFLDYTSKRGTVTSDIHASTNSTRGGARKEFVKRIIRAQKRHRRHGWLSNSHKFEIEIQYEYTIQHEYFKLHPERLPELYKYGNDVENVPWCWYLRCRIIDHKTDEAVHKGRSIRITEPVIRTGSDEDAEYF